MDPELEALQDLFGGDPAACERAWESFVARYSRLIVHTIRQAGGGVDDVMDRYAFVLERLRADDCRRLRTWSGSRARLSTWLVVVVQRLCTDFARQRYGRTGPASVHEVRAQRRRLADLVAVELRDDVVADATADDDPELALRTAELKESLLRAIATLEPADQLLLSLRFRDGLSAARIAAILSLPTPFHVYRRLNQLLLALRGTLAEQGIEDSVP